APFRAAPPRGLQEQAASVAVLRLEVRLLQHRLRAERVLHLFDVHRMRDRLPVGGLDPELRRLRPVGRLGDDVAREPGAVQHAFDRLAGASVADQLDLAELAGALDGELGALDRLRGPDDDVDVRVRGENILRGLQARRLRVAALGRRDHLDVLRRLQRLQHGRGPRVVERKRLEALQIGDLAGIDPGARLDAELAERRAVGHGRLADEDQPRYLRLDRGVVRADRGELAHDRDALLDRLPDRRDDRVPVVGLHDEDLVLAGRDRILDLRDLRLRVEVRIEELRARTAGLRLL